ncbi:hypothetical protein Sa4125_25180 [Aureimonas sp. SA4125]|uniref:head decoration protein n=1 Tax=Aureimonas sp. SA4125 TaxID=2826993 RepID=UPI001CC46748|nr:head decoration protein [Aureimonas sp. SA4125]BDA84976.1 hypothetical protein Sa4125_25180 [Aureimonas sp. SA4125]
MAILTEDRFSGAGHYLVSEAHGMYRSREQIVIASGSGVLKAGRVLSKLSSGAATATATGGNTGNATMSAVTTGTGVKTGTYRVEFTAATKFDVVDPDGFKLKSGTTGVAYADDLGFTITAGGTPMVAGDSFSVTVAAGSGEYVPYDATRPASAILFEGCDATSADVRRTATVRDAEVHADVLGFADDATDPQKTAALASLAAAGIIGR